MGEYGSSDDGDGDDGGFVGPARAGSARQTADEATSDGEDAFVGPARPTAMTTRVNVDDRDGDDGDDGDGDARERAVHARRDVTRGLTFAWNRIDTFVIK